MAMENQVLLPPISYSDIVKVNRPSISMPTPSHGYNDIIIIVVMSCVNK